MMQKLEDHVNDEALVDDLIAACESVAYWERKKYTFKTHYAVAIAKRKALRAKLLALLAELKQDKED